MPKLYLVTILRIDVFAEIISGDDNVYYDRFSES